MPPPPLRRRSRRRSVQRPVTGLRPGVWLSREKGRNLGVLLIHLQKSSDCRRPQDEGDVVMKLHSLNWTGMAPMDQEKKGPEFEHDEVANDSSMALQRVITMDLAVIVSTGQHLLAHHHDIHFSLILFHDMKE